MLLCWDRFLAEGNASLKYMIENFEKMFDTHSIKHFNIRDEGCHDIGSQEITKEHGSEIIKELLPWIRNEKEEGYLFENTYWKPFRDIYTITSMYLGYKRMFNFKQYYFQLSIDRYIEHDEECVLNGHCKHDDDCDDFKKKNCVDECDCLVDLDMPHFQLVLYGWKEKEDDIFLKPYEDFPILPDNIMPHDYWKAM